MAILLGSDGYTYLYLLHVNPKSKWKLKFNIKIYILKEGKIVGSFKG